MRPFSYDRPATLEAAIAAAGSSSARFVAGGTTLYDLMKLDVEAPSRLVDVTALRGFDEIRVDGGDLTFGALARMSDVAAHEVVRRRTPLLAEALEKAASRQLRNMATLGGNVLQRTRCSYFRGGSVFPCNKREPGSGCAALDGLDRGHALFGGSASCIATYPGDLAVSLVALEAVLETQGPAGRRAVPVSELHRLPGDTPHLETTLLPGEMITRMRVPAGRLGRASTYHKVRDRESYAFALVSAAVAVDIRGGTVREVRIALGGVATKPWRVPAAEAALVGRRLDAATAGEAGRIAFAEARPGRHNRFKVELGARTVADALLIAAGRSSAP